MNMWCYGFYITITFSDKVRTEEVQSLYSANHCSWSDHEISSAWKRNCQVFVISGLLTIWTSVFRPSLKFSSSFLFHRNSSSSFPSIIQFVQRLTRGNCSRVGFGWGRRGTMSSEGVKEDCLGWAARDPSGFLSPYKFSRRYCCDHYSLFNSSAPYLFSFYCSNYLN